MTRRVSIATCVCALTLLACGRSENRADTAASAAPSSGATSAASGAPSTSAPLSLAQAEGKWQGKTMPATGDSIVARWTLDAGQDTSKWVTTFTNGPKVPVHVVSIAGDSVVAQMGPYRSMTAKQAVTARITNHIHGDTLVGTFELRPVAKPDSVIRGRLQAVRAK